MDISEKLLKKMGIEIFKLKKIKKKQKELNLDKKEFENFHRPISKFF